MSIIVKKFGGTSVGSIEKIKRIAGHIATELCAKPSTPPPDHRPPNIVVVVSAMGKTTDYLFSLAHEISAHPNQRELDMLITAGERITMTLLSLALQERGIKSISFTGSQSGIITDNSHGNARILTVNAFRIQEELQKGKVVIVAGFQGVSLEKEITTLGRGGSDTTAVALACFLQADKCEIFTDVEGVLTADPRVVPNAQKLDNISFEEMLYLTLTGSKVLHSRAAEFAHKYQIPVEVKASPSNYELGIMNYERKRTIIVNNELGISNYKGSDQMEHSQVRVIAHKDDIVSFNVALTGGELPAFHTEIFDIHIINNTFVVLVEKKYAQQLIEELNQHNAQWTQDKDTYTIINISGYRICKDTQFLSDLHKTLRGICDDNISISNQGIGVQIIVNQAEAHRVIEVLHEKYIVSI